MPHTSRGYTPHAWCRWPVLPGPVELWPGWCPWWGPNRGPRNLEPKASRSLRDMARQASNSTPLTMRPTLRPQRIKGGPKAPLKGLRPPVLPSSIRLGHYCRDIVLSVSLSLRRTLLPLVPPSGSSKIGGCGPGCGRARAGLRGASVGLVVSHLLVTDQTHDHHHYKKINCDTEKT